MIDRKYFSRGELDSEINSSFTKNLCEELSKEKMCLGLSSLIEKSYDELFIIKQQDLNIKQLYREQTKKNTNKNERAS